MLGVALDERFDQSGFADPRWANDSNDKGRSFFREPVDEGNVETLFLDLYLNIRRGQEK